MIAEDGSSTAFASDGASDQHLSEIAGNHPARGCRRCRTATRCGFGSGRRPAGNDDQRYVRSSSSAPAEPTTGPPLEIVGISSTHPYIERDQKSSDGNDDEQHRHRAQVFRKKPDEKAGNDLSDDKHHAETSPVDLRLFAPPISQRQPRVRAMAPVGSI